MNAGVLSVVYLTSPKGFSSFGSASPWPSGAVPALERYL